MKQKNYETAKMLHAALFRKSYFNHTDFVMSPKVLFAPSSRPNNTVIDMLQNVQWRIL